jgi:squalene-hopene/tetraprenyl-beta-curcumene cyclase
MEEQVDALFKSTISTKEKVSLSRLERAIDRVRRYVLGMQDPVEGFWVDQLEADVTIPSEYLMFRRYIGRVDLEKEARLVKYIRSIQMEDGGWYLYRGGPSDLSATIKAYFALKLAGVSPDEPFMAKARRNILDRGGVINSNVFTKITLAMFGQYHWEGVPCMPAEIMLFPGWFYFNIYQVSYWSRTVIIPLLIIFHKKPVFQVPEGLGIDELFAIPEHRTDPRRHDLRFKREKGLFSWKNFFLVLDSGLRLYERHRNAALRSKAITMSYKWMAERMKGEGGLGAIYPAMANSVAALKCMGHPDGDPLLEQAIKSIEDLEVELDDDSMYLQPCVSPVWDTPIAMNALHESGLRPDHRSFREAADWLFKKQTSTRGDWKANVQDADPGGWYFQFENEFYPDNDDTSMVLIALLKTKANDEEKKMRRVTAAYEWLVKMQCSDGGWGSFDKDNNKLILNNIPFADHGALLDPSTEDLTGRGLEIMGLMGLDLSYPPAKAAYDFLLRKQETDGSWYGRWGVNYIYGTWSVLAGLRLIGEDMDKEYIRRAVRWLKSRQHEDGGWGESCDTYRDPYGEDWPSTASQTAWALIGLLSAGEAQSPEVKRGIEYLLSTQNADGYWDEDDYTGTGFPKVFYLRYHMYCKNFPLWALSMYHSITTRGRTRSEEVRLENRQKGTYRHLVG